MMSDRGSFRMDGECKAWIKEIQEVLQDVDRRLKRGRRVSEADAVRYAIKWTHNALTTQVRPEDLSDD